jgi:hypothetical protein
MPGQAEDGVDAVQLQRIDHEMEAVDGRAGRGCVGVRPFGSVETGRPFSMTEDMALVP